MASPISQLGARRYSTDELLRMRITLPVVSCVVHRLNTHPDIAAIVRIPEEALISPGRYSCQSKALIELTNKHKTNQLPQVSRRHNSGRSSEESEDQVLSASRSTRDSQRIHWHLRQRESSDHSAQPHSAPSGLAAQQSENFQRFYRAVISPTHVRVTAGGRIVPNTRATAPPAFDWNGEKFIFEPRKPLPDIESINFQPTPWIHSTPFPAGFPPLIAGSFLSPYNFLPQGNSLNLATMASQSLPDVLNQNHFENAQASKVSVEIAPTPLQSGPGPQQIKISPPHQFDHSKPFMYNGQWVYPVPPGFQPPPNALPLPISMLGNPNLAPQLSAPPVGNFHPPHIPGHITTLSNPLMLPQPHIQPIPMMMHNGAQPLENLPPAVYFPVTSMISVSEITKSQIQGLRNHLKYLDDQLANNKHQIDVSYMEAQRTATMAQIEQMEVMLEAQLAQENKASVEMHRESRKSTEQSQSATPNDGGKKGMAPACTLAMKTPEGSQDASGTQAPIRQTSKTEDVRTGKTGEGLGNAKLSSRSEPAFKSRLSAAAAMAPPFQPRTQAMVVKPPQPEPANGITRPTYRTPTTPDSIETQEQIEARLLSKSSSDWGKPSGVATAPAVGNPCLPKTQSMNETSVQNRNSNQPPTFQRFHTFPGPTFALAPQATVPAISPQAIPYLVGVLPQDMQASDAKATDLIYPRALTEEELHARVLYWGKAPRPAQSGLPKFDGKDFYPPSPVKGVARLAPNPPLIDSIANNQSTVVPLDFDNLFTEPGVPGYKTPSPLRPAISLQNLLPATEQFFLENESTRPPIYGYDSSAFPDWSTQDPNAVSYTPITPPAVNNLTRTTSSQDFSKLFSQRGVPGYKSPSPPRLEINQPRAHFDNENSEMPVTPENVEFPDETEGEDDETRTLDSWGVPTADARWAPKGPEFTPIEPERNDLQSNASTVEIHLTPKIKDGPSKDSSQTSFADRVAKFSSAEQQTLFLQNMLRNTTQTTMAAPALSGAVSSATAQGYLPQYHGFAAASLAPAILTNPASERGIAPPTTKPDAPKEYHGGVAPIVAANFLPENRPLNRDQIPRPERMGAEAYMRYLTRKADDDDQKIVEQGWNSSTTGTGPVMGSNW